MSSPLTAAEAWIWAAYMLRQESTEELFARDGSTDRHIALRDEADAVEARAAQLDGRKDPWRRAMRKWDAPVKPTRRNTKPASLPQRLDSAARSLKEP